MNWEALGAIWEIVGAVAVIATLGYLAVQMRQTTQAVKAATLQSQQQYGVHLRGQIIENADVARIWRLGMEDYDSLTNDEQVRFRMLMFNVFLSTEFRLDHSRQGLMEPEFTKRDDKLLRFYLGQPGVRQWWETASHGFTESFAQRVAALIREEAASGGNDKG